MWKTLSCVVLSHGWVPLHNGEEPYRECRRCGKRDFRRDRGPLGQAGLGGRRWGRCVLGQRDGTDRRRSVRAAGRVVRRPAERRSRGDGQRDCRDEDHAVDERNAARAGRTVACHRGARIGPWQGAVVGRGGDPVSSLRMTPPLERRRPAVAGLRDAASCVVRLERVDALRLVPGDADQLCSSLDGRFGPRARRGALSGRAARGCGVPRETVHACTSWCSWLAAGAGARVMRMSPLTVLARISTSGPSVAGASGDTSSSELVSPLTVLQSR